MKKLTDRQVKNLKPKEDRYEVWEGNSFGIRVFPSGKKSWVYMYRHQGRARRITFGQYPKMTVAEAHAAYGNALSDLEKGIDPGINKVNGNIEDRTAITVARLVEEYLEKWAKPRKKSWKEDERMLRRDIIPVWGKQKAKEIKRCEVFLLLEKIRDRGAPIAANRTLAVTRRMFNFAIERDIVEINPCHMVKAPSKENRRDRVLNDTEIKGFWNGLDKAAMAIPTKFALKLQLITAQRKGEIAAAEWEEFDLKNAWWDIPAKKTKNGLPHRVPLSKLALTMLKELKKHNVESKWLFPSPTNNSHIAGQAIDHALRKNLSVLGIKHCTPHDLRRTAASNMTALRNTRLVVSKILNHAENGVTAIYDRHSYDKEKRQALNLWSKRLDQVINKAPDNT